jgi:hypothetical protein
MNTFFNETNAQLLQEIKHQNLSGDEFEFKREQATFHNDDQLSTGHDVAHMFSNSEKDYK